MIFRSTLSHRRRRIRKIAGVAEQLEVGRWHTYRPHVSSDQSEHLLWLRHPDVSPATRQGSGESFAEKTSGPPADALVLIADLPLVDLNESVAEAVDAYISHTVMPNDPTGDALHLAAASFHRCYFLITWNCRHIANANKFAHIRRVNGILGLGNPALVTPLELLQEDTSDG